MDNMPFEEQYEDVLQNIEFSIIQVYREHPELTNWEALNGIQALIRAYQVETEGRQPAPPPSDPLAKEVYETVKTICEWRLGREMPFQGKDGEPPEDFSLEPVTLDEIIACLKRVRKSINFWAKKGGRQGYLTFVSQFVK